MSILIGLNDSHWQKVRWWKRHYIFKVYDSLVHCYFTSEHDCFKPHYFSKIRIRPGDEVVFDYKKKELTIPDTLSMDYSNTKILRVFKNRYEFTFYKACTIDRYYIGIDCERLREPVLVEPSKIYILNTFFNTLKGF